MKWFWPVVIILSAVVAGLVNFVLPDLPGRPLILLWFLCFCPGMALIRFFHLKDIAAECTLAIALSLAIDAAIAGIQLYAGQWSTSLTLVIIISLCIFGTLAQVIKGNPKQV